MHLYSVGWVVQSWITLTQGWGEGGTFKFRYKSLKSKFGMSTICSLGALQRIGENYLRKCVWTRVKETPEENGWQNLAGRKTETRQWITWSMWPATGHVRAKDRWPQALKALLVVNSFKLHLNTLKFDPGLALIRLWTTGPRCFSWIVLLTQGCAFGVLGNLNFS